MRIAVLAVVLLVACAQEQSGPTPVTNPTELYFGVTLNHHAINLSTVARYDTIQLVATARNALGQPYPHPSRVVYTSTDLAHVEISTSGLVTAVAPVLGAVITVADTIGSLVHVDTAIVNVSDTSTPPVLATFSIHPIPPDSAKWAALYPKLFAARALDGQGNPIPNLTVDYEVSDTSIATIDRQTGLIQGSLPGHVKFYATTTAYGITRADTLPFAFGFPIMEYEYPDSTGAFYPSGNTVGTGGSVIWFAPFPRPGQPPDSLDVVFDDSTHIAEDTLFNCRCGGGNIPAFADSVVAGNVTAAFRARSFPTPGTYTYHSRITHATGKIVVTDATTLPANAMRVRRP